MWGSGRGVRLVIDGRSRLHVTIQKLGTQSSRRSCIREIPGNPSIQPSWLSVYTLCSFAPIFLTDRYRYCCSIRLVGWHVNSRHTQWLPSCASSARLSMSRGSNSAVETYLTQTSGTLLYHCRSFGYMMGPQIADRAQIHCVWHPRLLPSTTLAHRESALL